MNVNAFELNFSLFFVCLIIRLFAYIRMLTEDIETCISKFRHFLLKKIDYGMYKSMYY